MNGAARVVEVTSHILILSQRFSRRHLCSIICVKYWCMDVLNENLESEFGKICNSCFSEVFSYLPWILNSEVFTLLQLTENTYNTKYIKYHYWKAKLSSVLWSKNYSITACYFYSERFKGIKTWEQAAAIRTTRFGEEIS